MDQRTILTAFMIVVVVLGGCTAPMTSSPGETDTIDDPDTTAGDDNGTTPTGPPPGPDQLLAETNTTGEG